MSLFRFVLKNLPLWTVALVCVCVFAASARAQPCGQRQQRHTGPVRAFFQAHRPGGLIPRSAPQFALPSAPAPAIQFGQIGAAQFADPAAPICSCASGACPANATAPAPVQPIAPPVVPPDRSVVPGYFFPAAGATPCQNGRCPSPSRR